MRLGGTIVNRRSARNIKSPPFCLLILLCCLPAQTAYGQTPGAAEAGGHAPPHSHPLSGHSLLSHNEATTIAIPNLTLTDQDNRKLNLYEDLLKGKLVVLNLFYTSCTGVCPTAGLWLSRFQNKLGERLGREVVLVSISIDPDVDTPEKVRRWSARWNRRPGWTLLTSKEKGARELVKQFLAYEAVGSHSPVAFVGDGSSKTINWVRVDLLNEGGVLSDYLESARGR
jgi:protein SCO1